MVFWSFFRTITICNALIHGDSLRSKNNGFIHQHAFKRKVVEKVNRRNQSKHLS